MKSAMIKRQNGDQVLNLGRVADNIFHTSLARFFDDNLWETGNTNLGSVPVNVRDAGHHYEMDVIAPGCKKDAFNIQVADNVLTISMNYQAENKEEPGTGWTRNEYVRRSFSRSFTLDDTVDVNGIAANYTDGVLHLTLPKKEEAKKLTKTVEVK